MRPGARSGYGSKQPSKAYQRAALQMVLVQRPDLDTLSVDSLVRSYGIAAGEITAAIDSERTRRRLGE